MMEGTTGCGDDAAEEDAEEAEAEEEEEEEEADSAVFGSGLRETRYMIVVGFRIAFAAFASASAFATAGLPASFLLAALSSLSTVDFYPPHIAHNPLRCLQTNRSAAQHSAEYSKTEPSRAAARTIVSSACFCTSSLRRCAASCFFTS